jgi:hypothetical protein
MSATIEQRAYFRDSVGDNGEPPAFDDPEIDTIYDELGVDYPNASNPELANRAVLRGIRILLVNAAKLVTYKQNQTTETSSDIYKHLRDLYDLYKDELTIEIAASASSVASWGALAGGHPKRQYGRDLSGTDRYSDLSRNRTWR